MKKDFEVNLQKVKNMIIHLTLLPLLLIGLLLSGIIGAISLSNLMEKISRKINPQDVFESCEKTGFYFHANQTIKCEIKK